MQMTLMLFFAPVLLTGVYFLGRSRAHRETAQRQSSLAKKGGDTDSQADGPAVVDQFLYDRCCRYMADRKPFLVESFSLGDLANVLFTNRCISPRPSTTIPERISGTISTTIG